MENTKCNKGLDGKCCCNCNHQIELFKHPGNIINKGAISESTNMYACLVLGKMEKIRTGVVFEQKHSVCEMHDLAKREVN